MTMPKPVPQQPCRALIIFNNFHPYLYFLDTDGCFYNDAAFMVGTPPTCAMPANR
jgi:hypothetical protein